MGDLLEDLAGKLAKIVLRAEGLFKLCDVLGELGCHCGLREDALVNCLGEFGDGAKDKTLGFA